MGARAPKQVERPLRGKGAEVDEALVVDDENPIARQHAGGGGGGPGLHRLDDQAAVVNRERHAARTGRQRTAREEHREQGEERRPRRIVIRMPHGERMVTCATRGGHSRKGRSTTMIGQRDSGVAPHRRPILPVALGAFAALALGACSKPETQEVWPVIRERYFIGFLKRNPVTCTYLGGDGYSPELALVNGTLPDVSPGGRDDAAGFYGSVLADLDRLDTASLAGEDRVDVEVVRAQIRFMLRLHESRYHARSVDTYAVAPFRGVDWQIQQMTDLGGGRYGTAEEWDAVVRRVAAVPAFLDAARRNLGWGVSNNIFPDRRMVQFDGIDAARDNAAYFRTTLPALAGRGLEGRKEGERIAVAIKESGEKAALAFEAFGAFLGENYRDTPNAPMFACGHDEYDWRLRNNLRLDAKWTAATLYEYGRQQVEETQGLLIDAARKVAERRGLRLGWATRAASLRSARQVMDDLSRDGPKSDEEMFRLYRSRAQDLVEYARRHAMFALPAEYRLEIVPTPPVLESTIDAAYYPAPPFKTSGIGRFYLTPSHGDVGVLKENNRHAVADLCAHEGFPGHDWHYQFMRSKARAIGNVRWLTPGEVEGSSSMWADSMATEGWALYAEQLMGEPQEGAPEGFYTPEERVYQLKGQLLRAARVRIDTGLHTGRMTFDEAVAYFTANVELLPDACAAPKPDPVRAAACSGARRAIYRYSKWPTQAITYHLGKAEILDLRERVRRIQGGAFSLRAFHERFLASGTIPTGYVRDTILEEARRR
ncbi:MAG: hypothetical protein DMF50_05590 [Acidobacteria bacterium]|nr:MAG: hypothetical protein DMF50_05590 [Acidobacteriota bacterium]